MGTFVITYKDPGYPSAREEQELLSALASKKARVVDQMPGALLVEGKKAELVSALQGQEGWTLSPAQKVEVAPHPRSQRLR